MAAPAVSICLALHTLATHSDFIFLQISSSTYTFGYNPALVLPPALSGFSLSASNRRVFLSADKHLNAYL